MGLWAKINSIQDPALKQETIEGFLDDPQLREGLIETCLTSFEFSMEGGTPPVLRIFQQREQPVRPEDYHIPMALLLGEATPEQINMAREKLGFKLMNHFNLGFMGDQELAGKKLAVSLESINLVTGVTIRDPRILGTWDRNTESIVQLPGRDLTKEYYQRLIDTSIQEVWDSLRDGKTLLETDISILPEKKQ